MILGQTSEYIRRRNTFTQSDWFGSAVAKHDLIDAVLGCAPSVEAVHIFEPEDVKSVHPETSETRDRRQLELTTGKSS